MASQHTLSRTATRDCLEIISYLHTRAGSSVADKIENRFFKAFSDLATGRALGHRRSDLTDRNLYFYQAVPYMIVFKQTKRAIQVVRVLHSSRALRDFI